jgi:DNA repair protein RadC
MSQRGDRRTGPDLLQPTAPAPPLADDLLDPPNEPPAHHLEHRQRLRRRFLDGDAAALPTYELLELLLFHAIDRVDVKPLAKDLLREFGDLGQVLAAEPARLKAHKRINERTLTLFKAIRETARRMALSQVMDRPVISSWSGLMDYCRVAMADEPVERFRILYLNRKNMLIGDEVQQRGTVDHTPVYPREVIKRALDVGATALILVHNHPSGDPTPSAADIAMTREIRDIGEKLGISLYDHVIVGKGGTTSLRELKLL